MQPDTNLSKFFLKISYFITVCLEIIRLTLILGSKRNTNNKVSTVMCADGLALKNLNDCYITCFIAAYGQLSNRLNILATFISSVCGAEHFHIVFLVF